jgi:ribonuclease BN (tRNA processing enzyme)
MRVSVIGGSGAWPTADQPCSGYLVEHDGFTLLLDPGYATFPGLLATRSAREVDAVLVTHQHPDHCADLNPLLRARSMGDDPCPALPVFSPPDALNAVLALDRPGMLDHAYVWNEFTVGERVQIGPFDVDTELLPHVVPNAGVRITARGRVVVYTGDTGPSQAIVELAAGADVLVADASYPEVVPGDLAPYLSSARQAGEYAAAAKAGRLVLTHLIPGGDSRQALACAARSFTGEIAVARPRLELDLT